MPQEKPNTLEAFLEIAPAEKKEETPVETFLELEKPAEEEKKPEETPAEEKPKEKEEEKPEPKAEEKKPAAAKTPTIYMERIKEYIDEGDWVDGTVEIEDENGEVKSVLLSELEDVDADTFKKLKAGQKSLREEELKAKYISVEGLDETTKKIIEAKKAGADTTALFKEDAVLINPLKNYDLTNPQVQEQLIRWDLTNKGEEPDDIDWKVAKYKKNFTLDAESEKIAGRINKDFDDKVKATLEAQNKANEEAAEAQKLFKKSIDETVKGWKVNDTITKMVVSSAAKFDESGLTPADRAYFEAKKDPELYAQIVFHLTDAKAFNEFKGVKIKNQEAQGAFIKISKIQPKAGNTAAKKEEVTIDPLEHFFTKKETTT